jgi:hypothetical protein
VGIGCKFEKSLAGLLMAKCKKKVFGALNLKEISLWNKRIAYCVYIDNTIH